MLSAFGIFPRILSTALWTRYAYAHFIDEITVVQAGPNNLKWSGFTPHVGVSNTHTSPQCCSREAPSLGEQSIWSRLMRRRAGQKQDGKRPRLHAQLGLLPFCMKKGLDWTPHTFCYLQSAAYQLLNTFCTLTVLQTVHGSSHCVLLFSVIITIIFVLRISEWKNSLR